MACVEDTVSAARRAPTPRRRPTGIVAGQALGIATRSARVIGPPPVGVISKPLPQQRWPPSPQAQPTKSPPVLALSLAPSPPARVARRAVLPRRHVSTHNAPQQICPSQTSRDSSDETVSTPRSESAFVCAYKKRVRRASDGAMGPPITFMKASRPPPTAVPDTETNLQQTRSAPTAAPTALIKEEPGCPIEDEQPMSAVGSTASYKRIMTEETLRAYETHNTTRFLQLATPIPQALLSCRDSNRHGLIESASSSASNGWTVNRKREAFERIRDFFWSRLDVGLEIPRALLRSYLAANGNRQGLFILGSSPQSTSLVVRSLLRQVERDLGSEFDFYHVKGHLYSTPHDLYDAIRHQMRGKWKLPQWRNVAASLGDTRGLPVAFTSTTSVLVVESIDTLVKTIKRTQSPLDRLFRFLNLLVQTRALKLLVIGHNTQTMQRFTSYFGGFTTENEDEYMLRLPQYTIATITEHLEAVAKAALTPMGSGAQLLDDVFAKQVIEFAARKAAKAGQCELDPVLNLLRYAMIRMLCQCRHDKDDYEMDQSKWKLRYEHVIEVSTKLFQHDLVHRIQCVGTMTQAVLLVLIDAGPCTEEELFQHVYERHKVHVWVLIITYFREKFDVALELLLSVPVVKTREVRVGRGDSWHTEIQYFALPSRQQFIEAAGKKPLIKLIL